MFFFSLSLFFLLCKRVEGGDEQDEGGPRMTGGTSRRSFFSGGSFMWKVPWVEVCESFLDFN